MLGASAGLVIEGVHRDALRTVIGAFAGGVFAHLAYDDGRERVDANPAWVKGLRQLVPRRFAGPFRTSLAQPGVNLALAHPG